MQFDLVKFPSAVEDFDHLVGVEYIDNELELEFITTRVTTHKGCVVGFQSARLTRWKIMCKRKITDTHRRYRQNVRNVKFEHPGGLIQEKFEVF